MYCIVLYCIVMPPLIRGMA